jgi:hypothetical protein
MRMAGGVFFATTLHEDTARRSREFKRFYFSIERQEKWQQFYWQ